MAARKRYREAPTVIPVGPSPRTTDQKPTGGGFWTDPIGSSLAAAAAIARNPVINPIGYAAGKAGKAVDNAVGTSVSGYIQDPIGQGFRDLGAPDAVQAIANPTGYVTRNTVNSGNAFGMNVPQSALDNLAGAKNVVNDVQNARDAVGDIGVPNLGDVFGDPAAGLGKYADRTQALAAGARGVLDPIAAARETQARDMYATGNAAQNRAASQTGYVNYGPAPTVAQTQQAGVGNYGTEQRVNAPTLASAQQAAMGSFGAQQSVGAARVGAAAQGSVGNFGAQQSVNAARVGAAAQAQAQQAQNQAGFLSGTAAQARDIADLDFAMANESRTAMGDSLNRIRGYVDQGPGESQAQAQLRMAQEQNLGDALSLARSGRGNAAGNMKMALSENAATNAQTNMQAALLRANESDLWRGRQLQGLGLEQQGTTAMRGQDITAATAQGQHAVSREQIASNVDVSRAGLEQQLAMNNAELGTRTNISNAEQTNLGTRLQAQLSTDAAIQQASLANARNIAVGQAGTTVSMGNAEQQNLGSRLQAQLSTEAGIQQAALANSRNIAMGQAGTQVGISNAEQANLTSRLQGQLQNDAAIQQAALANARNISMGDAGSSASRTNADNSAAGERTRAQLANELAVASGNSATDINQANLEAAVRQKEANDRLLSEMTGHGIDTQQQGLDAQTHGLDLERDYSKQAAELAAEMAKARAIRQAALIGGGASLIEELIPG